jgi:hypothetical protein
MHALVADDVARAVEAVVAVQLVVRIVVEADELGERPADILVIERLRGVALRRSELLVLRSMKLGSLVISRPILFLGGLSASELVSVLVSVLVTALWHARSAAFI